MGSKVSGKSAIFSPLKNGGGKGFSRIFSGLKIADFPKTLDPTPKSALVSMLSDLDVMRVHHFETVITRILEYLYQSVSSELLECKTVESPLT